jgi:molybdate transport system ATP-binding protein
VRPSTQDRADPADLTGLVASITVRRGSFELQTEFAVSPGTILAVVGPNGAGKSTLLGALAGTLPLAGGRITLAGRTLADVEAGVHLPPEERRVGIVFQDQLLFPHLKAMDNVAFGLQASGLTRPAAREIATGWLERLGIGDLADRRPSALSGGQAARVALARTLAPAPQLVLLDEPLAALDAPGRASLRTTLREHLSGFQAPSLLVTHDPVEALVIADEVIVLEAGRVSQRGSPAQVAREPRSEYAARLVGMNLFRGTAENGAVALDEGGALRVADRSTTGRVFVSFRPSSVMLSATELDASPRNTWCATISGIESVGDRMRLALTGPPDILADITAEATAELGIHPGERVWAAVKATDIEVYPAL